MYDILIIGAGAAGLVASITVARNQKHLKIAILEKNKKPGRKIAASGNGRCNITNIGCDNSKDTINFFDSIGITTKEEKEGRVYPYSEQAVQVVASLVSRNKALGVDILCDKNVEKIEHTDEDLFWVYVSDGSVYRCKKLLIATGGKASPIFGTTGDGYAFAKKMGHRITRLAPILTFIDVGKDIRSLAGIRAKGTISLERNKKMIAKEKGEIQFIENAVSGISAFNLSRFIRLEANETPKDGFEKYTLSINFMPEYEIEEIEYLLRKRTNIEGILVEELLDTILDKRIAKDIFADLGINIEKYAKELSTDEILQIASLISKYELKVKGVGGWKNAQCTAGGILLEEIDLQTMESKILKNLYFAGEIIDYDGPCGGYNLQNAWETGIKAGNGMTKEKLNV